jgi:hypothetical protein
MIGKFENGQRYSFYMTLTDQIMDIVELWRREKPADLLYNGMDFSRALETSMYFGAVHDEALNALEAGEQSSGSSLLSDDLIITLARRWFGRQRTRPFEKSRDMPAKMVRAARRAIRWQIGSLARPLITEANLPSKCEILLYGRSPRMVQYLAPIAERLADGCAYFVPGNESQLQKLLAEEGKPFVVVANTPRLRPISPLVGQYVPYLGLFADGIERILRRMRPRVILLAEGNSPDDEVINLVGIKLGIPVICLQQGWSPILHPGFRNMHYSAMLVWGPAFAELLSAANPRQRFISTGNHVLRSAFRPPLEKPPGVLFFHQDTDRGLGGRRGTEMMVTLAQRLASASRELPIYYRPHPLVPLDDSILRHLAKHRNIVIQEPSFPLAKALDQARVTVSIYSTTIMESAASGSIPVIFNMTSMPHFWPDMNASGAAVEVHTLEDAFDALQRLLSDNAVAASYTPALQEFTARFFSAIGDSALENVIEVLRNPI